MWMKREQRSGGFCKVNILFCFFVFFFLSIFFGLLLPLIDSAVERETGNGEAESGGMTRRKGPSDAGLGTGLSLNMGRQLYPVS